MMSSENIDAINNLFECFESYMMVYRMTKFRESSFFSWVNQKVKVRGHFSYPKSEGQKAHPESGQEIGTHDLIQPF